MRTNRRKMMYEKADLNVEYITSTGLQYIYTDWVPLLKTMVSTKVRYHFNPTDSDPYAITLFSTIDKDRASFSITKGGDVPGRYYHLEAYNNYLYPIENPISITVDDEVLYEFTLDSYGLSINGKKIESHTRYVKNISSMMLMNLSENNNKTTLDFYGCKCWNDGKLERDFVPAKKNGIYGLYDKVNKKFWRSSTGVDFLGKDK